MSSDRPDPAQSTNEDATDPAGEGRIFITGATGFVGSNLRAALGDRPVRLLVRDATKDERLRRPTVELVEGDVTRPDSLRGTMDGCQSVIHLVGIIEETGSGSFDAIIRRGTENVLAEARRAGIGHFVHMSAMGATDDSAFPYLQAKWKAEEAVRSGTIPWTIFRPSVIFGPGDGFINPLALLVKLPLTPVVGDGQSRFMPVAVAEVSEIFAATPGRRERHGQTYELGGGKIYTFTQMLDAIGNELGKHHPRVKVPVPLISAVVALSNPLPPALRPPVTGEQLKMLKISNTTDRSATGDLLGRPPLALEDGLDYLRPGARNRPPD
jgi:uncharacterized protein YbjT (DUF2867 family)